MDIIEQMREKILLISDPNSGYTQEDFDREFGQGQEMIIDEFYKLLQDNYDILTEKTKGMLPYMIARNWLVSYASLAGLEIILFQMDYRTKHRANMQESIVEVQEFYSEFEEEFTLFFEELRNHCEEKLKELE
jgi:acyl carrier protein phosphodiesterase